MNIARTNEEIARVENWAVEALDEGSRYPGMSCEQGIMDMLMWLRGDSEHAPDQE